MSSARLFLVPACTVERTVSVFLSGTREGGKQQQQQYYSCCVAMGRVQAFLGNSEQQTEEEEEEEGQKDRIPMNTTGSLAA